MVLNEKASPLGNKEGLAKPHLAYAASAKFLSAFILVCFFDQVNPILTASALPILHDDSSAPSKPFTPIRSTLCRTFLLHW